MTGLTKVSMESINKIFASTQKLPRGFVDFLAYLLAVIFLLAAVLKVFSPSVFLTAIRSTGLLPVEFTLLAGFLVVLLELATALLLTCRKWQLMGSSLGAGLLTLFLLVALYASLKRIEITCGCFGPLGDSTNITIIIQDAILLVFCITVYVNRKRQVQATLSSE